MIIGKQINASGLSSGTRINISPGGGYGFAIVPAATVNVGSNAFTKGIYPLKLWLKRLHTAAPAEVWVTGPAWFRVPEGFAGIEIELLDTNQGNFFINIGTTPHDEIQVAGNPLTTQLSAIADAFTATESTENQALTRTDPNTSAPAASAYVDISGQNYTGFFVSLDAGSGNTITGGTIDIYRYNHIISAWARVAQWTPITGKRYAQSPDDFILARNSLSRIFAATNGITLAGGGTTIDVSIVANYITHAIS